MRAHPSLRLPRPEPGSVRRARAGRWRLAAALAVVLVGLLGPSAAAWANIPQPQALSSSESIDPATGHVTVTVTGTWLWPFASLHPTASKPCDNRVGAGWSVVWNDPDDPGYPIKGKRSAVQVDAGSTGSNGLNAQEQVVYNQSAPCGSFVQTDSPRAGDGNAQGPISDSHVYASAATVPAVVCVIMYDLGFPPGPAPKRVLVTNNDNTVDRGVKGGAAFVESTNNNTCTSPNGQAVTTAATTPTTAPPTTPTTPAPAPVVKPSTALAYTGAGPGLGLLADGGGLSLVGAAALFAFGRRTRRSTA